MEALDVRRMSYARDRDARVALIRCGECREYYETSARQSRRIRNGETRRLCEMCRKLEQANEATPDQTESYLIWWVNEAGMSPDAVLALAKQIHPHEARTSGLAMSPSRRLPNVEGNNSAGFGAGVYVCSISQLVTSTTIAA